MLVGVAKDSKLKEERLSDEELLKIGLESKTTQNKERWRKAPYCWNAKGFLFRNIELLAVAGRITPGS